MLRLIGASRGDPYHPQSVSGVPRHLFDALGRRYTLVSRIDTRLPRLQQALVALATFHPVRAIWQERYFKNVLAFQLQSRHSQALLRQVAEPFDLVLQIYGLFRTSGAAYIVYADNTHQITLRDWPDWNPLRGRQLAEWLANERMLYQQAQHVFAVSQRVAHSLRTEYGLAAEQVSVVGGGFNFDTLPVLAAESQRKPVILFVGREFVRKGGDCLLDAFRIVRSYLPHARLQIAGAERGDDAPNVEWLGELRDRQHLAHLYAEATVFCLPSRFDPFPGVLSEAMAHGLPCVSTNVCGIPEIVQHEQTGLVVPPGDAVALAMALIRLLDNPQQAAAMGAAGRVRVEQHLNWDAVVERMAPVLDGLKAVLPAAPPVVGKETYGKHPVFGVATPETE